MSQKRLKTWQKATALVPLALLSGAWTASLATTAVASDTSLPDGTAIPNSAIEAPASLSNPGEIALGVAGSTDSIISSASVNGIPSAALAAYKRASQVMGSADASCKISWQLIAAIGRVESDHGRYGGNTVGNDGKSRPGIFGIPLDGSNGTARITDSDAGQYDDDPIFDRAVGPMQFIPSTWSVVGVDGDADDVRDPQDIDDAALATAVYLCSGDEDLSTTAGQSASVYRYNHSQEYVDLVLSIMNAYIGGDFSPIPNGTAAQIVFTPTVANATGAAAPGKNSPKSSSTKASGGGSGSGGGTAPTGGGGSTSPAAPDADPTDDPTAPVTDPVTDPAPDPLPVPDPVPLPTPTPLQEATAYCQDNLSSTELTLVGGMDACTSAYLDGGASAVQALLNAASGVGGLL